MKILFIFHEADLTGAPLALLSAVKWFSENTGLSMSFLLKKDGVLNGEISKSGQVYLWDKVSLIKGDKQYKLLNKIYKIIYRYKLILNLKRKKFDIIYANSILCSDLIKRTSHFNCKVIWHIHELELALRCVGKHHLKADKYVHFIIANSKSTKENLIRNGIDGAKISVHYPSISVNKIRESDSSSTIRDSLGIPADATIIGSSGSAIDRKGVTQFIELPLIIDYLLPGNNFYYLWVGKIFNNEIVVHDIGRMGLKSRIFFVGEQDNPIPYYRSFDIFVSCSKEESFGLSAIEAASLNKPLVCFENTGGIEEIVRQAGNSVVPYLNLIQMARKIIEISGDRNKMKEFGNRAYKTALEYDTKIIMPKMYNYLLEVEANNSYGSDK